MLFQCNKKGYVDVGFYCNTTLKMYNEFLVSENRKAVKSLRYFKLKEINSEVLVSVLSEAYETRNK